MDNFSPGVKNSVFGGATNPSTGLDTRERIAPAKHRVRVRRAIPRGQVALMRIEDSCCSTASYKEEGAIVARCMFVSDSCRKIYALRLVLREVRVVVYGRIGEVRYQTVLPIVGIR